MLASNPRPRLHLTFRLAMGAIALVLSSCTDLYYYGPTGRMSGRTVYLEGYDASDPRYRGQQRASNSWWRGDGVPGTPHIVISLSRQEAYFYKSGQLVGVSALSTGDESHQTPQGRFSVQQKDMWHQSSQYGDYVDQDGNPVMQNIDRQLDPQPPGTRFDGANMHYFMRFTRGIGMHAGYLPGYPASHGCVRMPGDMAEAFFRNVGVGTPVEVRY